MKRDGNPEERVTCGAKTRSGGKCGQVAMNNGRCRYHGGKSLSGSQHGRYKNGQFTKEALEARRQLAELMRMSRDLIRRI